MYFTRINSCDTSHYPKENLPVGWSFVSFSDVISLLSGRDLDVSQCNSEQKGTPYLVGASCIDNDHICFYRWTETPEVISLKDDILLSCKGTVGEVVLNTVGKIHIARQFMAIRSKWPELLIPDYIEIFIKSSVQYLKITAKGIIPGISRIDIMTLGIAIPPIAEQKRIARRVDAIFKMISEFENRQSSLKDSVEKSKARILDLAIHGKLVPQDASDEPAIEMLKRINPDFKPSHNLHYDGDLPKGWCFCTIGDLFQHNAGKALNTSFSRGEMLRYITTSNLYWGRFDLTETNTMYFTENEKEKCCVIKGDLLVCEGGDIGRAANWPYDESIMIQNHIHRLRPKEEVSTQFFYYVLYLYKRKGLIGGKGIGIQGLSSRELDRIIVPVPPVKEQYKIVAEIEEANQALERIEKACISRE